MNNFERLCSRHTALIAWRQAIQAAHRGGAPVEERNRKACQRHWEQFQKEVRDSLKSATLRKERLQGERAALLERAAVEHAKAASLNSQNRGLLLAIEMAQEVIDALTPLTEAAPLPDASEAPPLQLSDCEAHYRKACGSPWERLSRSDRISLVTAAVVTLLCAATVLFYHDFAKHPEFSIAPPAGPLQRIAITCTNPLSETISVRAPWPSTGPAPDEESPLHTGIETYVRFHDSPDFRRWDGPLGSWTFEERSTANRAPVEIAPGITSTILFQPDTLEIESLNIDAIEIRCTNGSGQLLRSRVLPIPSFESTRDKE